MNKKLVFREEWFNAISSCPDMVRLEVYDAAMCYAFGRSVPVLSKEATMAYEFIRCQIDSDKENYSVKCDRLRENANKRWSMQKHANGCNCMQLDANALNPKNDSQVTENKDNTKPQKPNVEELKMRLEARKKKFVENLSQYVEYYGRDMVNAFYKYWTEPNKSGSKMRWEMERTWDLQRRLARWASNNKEF